MRRRSLGDEGTETDISIQTALKAPLYVTAAIFSLFLCLLVVIASRLSA